MNKRIHVAEDGQSRCAWCEAPGFEAYRHYHDTEWGFPVSDETRLFEKLCLEGFQSGLSWRTILAKREAFRAGFAGFDPARVAAFDESDVQRLLGDAGIVRHRGKIEAAIHNARLVPALREEFGSLAVFFWGFEETAAPEVPVRGESETSRRLSKTLRGRGFKFVGPTTCYAFMQAMGLINDHAPGCGWRAKADAARQAFTPPR
ncbi:DNA-3-methyladenine glycosylase I [Mitsuaria sp. WAJ17]|uniref:DNA-3-methyladenine glycosylase I n=1 Tax=Mitsuaria sp. WAJ17 TaxID=2761452 RepID=UPI001601ED52|nr:DNA-3-methyladenine glycosylase I [Mitsuaria sp. WAJ17]MBB2487591.1 DNA-3-methyladenine glycosylase I [Mitsuaria sp. WAJ17]